VAHEIDQPGEQQVRLVADLGGQRPAVLGLDGLEPAAVLARLAGRQHRDREEEAVAAVALDRRRRQGPGHARRPHTA
jgi:hypothetical protein